MQTQEFWLKMLDIRNNIRDKFIAAINRIITSLAVISKGDHIKQTVVSNLISVLCKKVFNFRIYF